MSDRNHVRAVARTFTKTVTSALLSSIVVIASLEQAQAVSFTFSGSLATDDDVSLFDFTVDDRSRVTIGTFSYGGGTLDDGTEVEAGGFDPIITLFNSSGSFLDSNDDGFGQFDPMTGSAFDSELRPILEAGDYTVAVTQYDNFFNGSDLGDGPERDGQPNFTSEFGCMAGQFCDVGSNSRTNEWVAQVRVPEPSTILASGLLLGFVAAAERKRRQTS